MQKIKNDVNVEAVHTHTISLDKDIKTNKQINNIKIKTSKLI